MPVSPFGGVVETGLRTLSVMVESVEWAVIIDALRRHQGSLSPSTEALGMAKPTLHDRIREYGLNERR